MTFFFLANCYLLQHMSWCCGSLKIVSPQTMDVAVVSSNVTPLAPSHPFAELLMAWQLYVCCYVWVHCCKSGYHHHLLSSSFLSHDEMFCHFGPMQCRQSHFKWWWRHVPTSSWEKSRCPCWYVWRIFDMFIAWQGCCNSDTMKLELA